MHPKLSIIMPIYNMEAYLRRSLDSLLEQSFTDFEIIAVNDGSTDSSGSILDAYAAKDARLILCNRDNGGVSSARNAGLAMARGEFIGFVDPDDWVNLHMYEELVHTADSEEADIVMCTYIREFGSHAKAKPFPLPERVAYRNEEVHEHVLRRLVGPAGPEVAQPEMLDAWGTVWTKLYRGDLLRRHRLQFTDLQLIGSNEDTLFNIQAVYYSRSFIFLNKPLYHYWRANTSSVTSSYNPQLSKQFKSLYQAIENFLGEKELGQEYVLALHNRIGMNTLGLGLNTVNRGNHASSLAKIKDLGALLKDAQMKRSLQQFELAHCPVVWKTFFWFAKHKFAFGLYFMLTAADRLRTRAR
ncbi:glycosyl transferase family 2 [Paenibacillus swuensis]|uniref:Glycosyl transferase family 2 n=1 Tax=Paenibacillus swuensis TaxID=1178515 RepID=A0A172TGT2_9BACL|nr:glycosyltransferase [Paenibacillus swuensis]ANE46259.1 glycosyl transferase family 2 [Paenibacillus swuensis]